MLRANYTLSRQERQVFPRKRRGLITTQAQATSSEDSTELQRGLSSQPAVGVQAELAMVLGSLSSFT